MPHRSFWLEVTGESFRPVHVTNSTLHITRATTRDYARCSSCWSAVGKGFWTARSRWTAARWRRHLGAQSVTFCLATHGGEDVGFFELQARPRGARMEGFGLAPKWRGRGLGAILLSVATRWAFEHGARRVYLHTATDDHPHAMPNYTRRGYRVFRERELIRHMPASDQRSALPPNTALERTRER